METGRGRGYKGKARDGGKGRDVKRGRRRKTQKRRVRDCEDEREEGKWRR